MGEADKQPLISVIVPIYNVEPYLRTCVDSILNQTYHNLEIILVDDGSPDGCPAICDEYAEKDPRIRVIHKKNGGLSAARNAGLAIYTGEYIMFVDSDDWLTAHAVETLFTLTNNYGAQLVIGNYVRDSDPSEFHVQSGEHSIQIMNCSEAMENMLRTGCSSWARLYKSTIHKNILFPIGEINEDEAIVLQLLEQCTTVVLTSQIVYGYRCRPESITTSSFSVKKLDWYRHCKANLEWIKEHHPELTDAAAARYRSSILWSLTEIALSNGSYPDSIRDLLSDLHQNQTLFKNIPFSYLSDSIRMWFLLHFPFDFYRILIRMKRRIS